MLGGELQSGWLPSPPPSRSACGGSCRGLTGIMDNAERKLNCGICGPLRELTRLVIILERVLGVIPL